MVRSSSSFNILLSTTIVLAGLLSSVRISAQVTLPSGNAPYLTLFGDGVQIYNSAPDPNTPGAFIWSFIAPQADLFTNNSETMHFGMHFGTVNGPAWQADTSGSEVVGLRIGSQASPNPNSIPELLLSAKSHLGTGIFDSATYIQRLNTVGGLAPSALPTGLGQESQSHYTATYLFASAVPEPGAIGLLAGIGCAGILQFCRKRRV